MIVPLIAWSLPLQVYLGRGGFRDCFIKIKAGDHKKLVHASPLKKGQSMKFKTMAEVHQLFLEIDTDGSGLLDRAEVQKLCKRLYLPVTRSELDHAMSMMDADGSGTVDYAEFQEWWGLFQQEQKRTKQEQTKLHKSTGTVDEITFKVWLNTNNLGDYARPLAAEGFSTFSDLFLLGGRAVVDLLLDLGISKEMAMPLLLNLEARAGARANQESFVKAAAVFDLPESERNRRGGAQIARLPSKRRRRKRRSNGPNEPIPHYSQPNLAAMLPEFVNAGAERAQGVWGLRARSSSDALSEHKVCHLFHRVHLCLHIMHLLMTASTAVYTS